MIKRWVIHVEGDRRLFGPKGVVCRHKFWGVRRTLDELFDPPDCKSCLRRLNIREPPKPRRHLIPKRAPIARPVNPNQLELPLG